MLKALFLISFSTTGTIWNRFSIIALNNILWLCVENGMYASVYEVTSSHCDILSLSKWQYQMEYLVIKQQNKTWNSLRLKWQRTTWQEKKKKQLYINLVLVSLQDYFLSWPCEKQVNIRGIGHSGGCCRLSTSCSILRSSIPYTVVLEGSRISYCLMELKCYQVNFSTILFSLSYLLFPCIPFFIVWACWWIGGDMPLEFSTVNFGTLHPLGWE